MYRYKCLKCLHVSKKLITKKIDRKSSIDCSKCGSKQIEIIKIKTNYKFF